MKNIEKLISIEDISDSTLQNIIFELYKMSQENAKHIAILNDETGELRDYQKSLNTKMEKNEESMTSLTTQVEIIKTDLNWTKKILWLIFGSSITMVIGLFGKMVFDLVTR